MDEPLTVRERSRRLEQLAIQEAAIDLTLEKGFGGFTMDELAARVGMPRRTLFQRVGDKMSAVLGAEEPPRADRMPPRDPSLSPLDACITLAVQLIDAAEVDESVVAIHTKMRSAIAREPTLADESRQRTARNLASVAEALRDVHGWDAHDPRPQVLASVMGALVEQAVAHVLAAHEQGTTLNIGDELRRLADTLTTLVRPSDAQSTTSPTGAGSTTEGAR